MEQNKNNEKPKRNPTECNEGADNRCYRHVNQLGITPAPWYCEITHNKTDSHVMSINSLMPVCQHVLPHNQNIVVLAPDMAETIVSCYKDMGLIDRVCDIAGVHRFTLMRRDLESIINRLGIKLD